jgi:hypothetical protein
VYCDFTGRLAAQLINYSTYPIYKFDIALSTQQGYSIPAWLLAGTNFLYSETPNMWRREDLVLYQLNALDSSHWTYFFRIFVRFCIGMVYRFPF